MFRRILFTTLLVLAVGGIADAGERIDLIGPDGTDSEASHSSYILDASWDCVDPYGEFDPSLGAAGALNRAIGLLFAGHASPEQIETERLMAEGYTGLWPRIAPFAVEVLGTLQVDYADSLPEQVELNSFDLSPSEVFLDSPDNPHIVAVRYDKEEYLERLLQRLYFKLIQGPVLLTVPYQGDAGSVPEEFRNWHNVRYSNGPGTNDWDDIRLVWVDWSLTQTVVLCYEDGLIACYDSGRKYYIDHTAAIATAGAMLLHPELDSLPPDTALNYVLTACEENTE